MTKTFLILIFIALLPACATSSQNNNDIRTCMKACRDGAVSFFRDDAVTCECKLVNNSLPSRR